MRNRLESNAEHWSALLLSLRELTEWVIRKDTELSALAPVRGDLPALLKQQVRLYHLVSDTSYNLLSFSKKYYISPIRCTNYEISVANTSKEKWPPPAIVASNSPFGRASVSTSLMINNCRGLRQRPRRLRLAPLAHRRFVILNITASILFIYKHSVLYLKERIRLSPPDVIDIVDMMMDDHRAFRRQLEDKRPVVESNLLSGRQYIANEPALSDTSDSERE
ncbi:Dystrophin, isoform D [Eumeta japonica]|uniref:Dystrophin, isoform D n=1 Tax=Eumeta variegata TaxID=151549 RepID=A0A4C1W248_EUMVA|nr:Dystrophin, isoform D [Eumeta japonica]